MLSVTMWNERLEVLVHSKDCGETETTNNEDEGRKQEKNHGGLRKAFQDGDSSVNCSRMAKKNEDWEKATRSVIV